MELESQTTFLLLERLKPLLSICHHGLLLHSHSTKRYQAYHVLQGPIHPDVGLVCQETALLMERTRRLPQARDALQRSLDIRAVSLPVSVWVYAQLKL